MGSSCGIGAGAESVACAAVKAAAARAPPAKPGNSSGLAIKPYTTLALSIVFTTLLSRSVPWKMLAHKIN